MQAQSQLWAASTYGARRTGSIGWHAHHELELIKIAQVDELGRASLVKLARRNFAIDHHGPVIDKDADGVKTLLLDEV